MAEPEAVAAGLQGYLGSAYLVRDLTNLSMGWESDVYGFTLENAATGHATARVLRLYFGRHAAYTAEREATALRLLRQAGYPVPQVYTVETEAAALGRPFMIMQRVRGGLLWSLMLPLDTPQAEAHLDQFCRLLVKLHQLAWQTLPAEDVARLPRRDVAEQLAFLEGMMARHPLDGFGEGWDWLRGRQETIPPVPLAMVHWDFHPANVLFNPPDQYAVIDWTQAEIGDPRFDLAWTLLLAGTQASWDAAGRIQAGYAAQGGAVGPELDFFMAAVCLRRLSAVMVSLTYGAETLGMRPSAEAIMTAYLDRIAQVYVRWLEITEVRLAEADRRLAPYL